LRLCLGLRRRPTSLRLVIAFKVSLNKPYPKSDDSADSSPFAGPDHRAPGSTPEPAANGSYPRRNQRPRPCSGCASLYGARHTTRNSPNNGPLLGPF
jgi:hypothetical protein